MGHVFLQGLVKGLAKTLQCGRVEMLLVIINEGALVETSPPPFLPLLLTVGGLDLLAPHVGQRLSYASISSFQKQTS